MAGSEKLGFQTVRTENKVTNTGFWKAEKRSGNPVLLCSGGQRKGRRAEEAVFPAERVCLVFIKRNCRSVLLHLPGSEKVEKRRNMSEFAGGSDAAE
jgi:hypothetical protein